MLPGKTFITQSQNKTLTVSNFVSDVIALSLEASKQNLIVKSITLSEQQLIGISRVIRAKSGNFYKDVNADAVVLAIDTSYSVVELHKALSNDPAFMTLTDMTKTVGKDIRVNIIP